MKVTLFLASAATALASPLLSERQTISTDPNAPCGQQPFGFAGPSGPDVVFANNPNYNAIALAAPTPSGYSSAFRARDGATSQAGYAGFYFLETYNTTQCASLCNAASGCVAFNIYFERDPTLNPAPACPNPPGTVNIKCSLWNSPVSAATATNKGQTREQFVVDIQGSDGFNQS